MFFGNSGKNVIDAALLEHALQHQERTKDKSIGNRNVFGKIEKGQNIFVFADGADHLVHAVFARTAKRHQRALSDFSVLAVGFNEMKVFLTSLIGCRSNVHDTSLSKLTCQCP